MSVVIFRKGKAPSKVEKPPIEETTSRKDFAFDLFDLGKTPDSPEVEALGLKLESAKKYFRLWKQQQ